MNNSIFKADSEYLLDNTLSELTLNKGSRPCLGIVSVHPFEKLAARGNPALDATRQDHTLHLSVALLGDVVPEPSSSTRAPPAA